MPGTETGPEGAPGDWRPPRDNSAVWREVRATIATRGSGAGKPDGKDFFARWRAAFLPLLDAVEQRGLVPFFRFGTSMHTLVISTADRHGLLDEPRITMEFLADKEIVHISYSRRLYPLVLEERLPPDDVLPTLLRYLRILWRDTKPESRTPVALHPPLSPQP